MIIPGSFCVFNSARNYSAFYNNEILFVIAYYTEAQCAVDRVIIWVGQFDWKYRDISREIEIEASRPVLVCDNGIADRRRGFEANSGRSE